MIFAGIRWNHRLQAVRASAGSVFHAGGAVAGCGGGAAPVERSGVAVDGDRG